MSPWTRLVDGKWSLLHTNIGRGDVIDINWHLEGRTYWRDLSLLLFPVWSMRVRQKTGYKESINVCGVCWFPQETKNSSEMKLCIIENTLRNISKISWSSFRRRDSSLIFSWSGVMGILGYWIGWKRRVRQVGEPVRFINCYLQKPSLFLRPHSTPWNIYRSNSSVMSKIFTFNFSCPHPTAPPQTSVSKGWKQNHKKSRNM